MLHPSALSLRSDAADLIALDGKTLRRSGDSGKAQPPLHLVSAWASSQNLVLAQEPVDAKETESATILEILKRLTLKGTLVTIDAIATNPEIAAAITNPGGDRLLALKSSQPPLHREVARGGTGSLPIAGSGGDDGRLDAAQTALGAILGPLRRGGGHHGEAEACFATAPANEIDIAQGLDKSHGGPEIRTREVSGPWTA